MVDLLGEAHLNGCASRRRQGQPHLRLSLSQQRRNGAACLARTYSERSESPEAALALPSLGLASTLNPGIGLVDEGPWSIHAAPGWEPVWDPNEIVKNGHTDRQRLRLESRTPSLGVRWNDASKRVLFFTFIFSCHPTTYFIDPQISEVGHLIWINPESPR